MPYKQHKQYRLPGYNYAQSGAYFITICTQDRQHYFGQIQEGVMHLSEAGTIAKDNLLMIPEQFNNTVLDEWVVMPNHIHMILIIDGGNMTGRSMINHGPTNHVPTKSGIPNNPMELPVDTIGKMMRWYKGKVSYECRRQGHTFAWQARPGRPGFTTISSVMNVLRKISESIFSIIHRNGRRIGFILSQGCNPAFR